MCTSDREHHWCQSAARLVMMSHVRSHVPSPFRRFFSVFLSYDPICFFHPLFRTVCQETSFDTRAINHLQMTRDAVPVLRRCSCLANIPQRHLFWKVSCLSAILAVSSTQSRKEVHQDRYCYTGSFFIFNLSCSDCHMDINFEGGNGVSCGCSSSVCFAMLRFSPI